jgi:acyl carrier protein
MSYPDIEELFSDIIGTDDVIADDNFFDIGGNSILALRLIAEIEQRYGVSLALLDVIRAATPRGVAGLIARARAGDPAASGGGPPAAGFAG